MESFSPAAVGVNKNGCRVVFQKGSFARSNPAWTASASWFNPAAIWTLRNFSPIMPRKLPLVRENPVYYSSRQLTRILSHQHIRSPFGPRIDAPLGR